MPVRNALPYLDDAVRSILAQTHGNFEFVIGDDGSTDGSRECLREWARRDRRIRLLESDRSRGPAGSSNWVAEEAAFPLVARMDADDISRPHRLERQIETFRVNPDAVMVGSMYDSIDARGALTRRCDRSALLRRGQGAVPIAHGSIMYRGEAFRRIGGYREHCAFFEDLDLHYRMAREGRILVIPEPLYVYRYSSNSARLRSQERSVQEALDFCFRCLAEPNGSDDLFPEQRALPTDKRLLPQAIKVPGMLRLWSGHRPAILRTLLRRARFDWSLETIAILAWALLGRISPAGLRAFLRARSRWRDAAARRLIDDGGAYDWTPAMDRVGQWSADGQMKQAPEQAERIEAIEAGRTGIGAGLLAH